LGVVRLEENLHPVERRDNRFGLRKGSVNNTDKG
jgi:hypothetical protein